MEALVLSDLWEALDHPVNVAYLVCLETLEIQVLLVPKDQLEFLERQALLVTLEILDLWVHLDLLVLLDLLDQLDRLDQ